MRIYQEISTGVKTVYQVPVSPLNKFAKVASVLTPLAALTESSTSVTFTTAPTAGALVEIFSGIDASVYTRLKLALISSECGSNVSPSILNNYFNDPRQDLSSIARLLMTTNLSLLRAADLPEPPENRPLNWTAVGGTPCPYAGPWFGVAPIAYAHPFYPGFTYGAPVTLPIYF